MSKINDGGLAFPGKRIEKVEYKDCSGPEIEVNYPGMSLRDWLAGMVIQGLCVSHNPYGDRIVSAEVVRNSMAETSYQIADAMLAERDKEPK